MSRGRGKRMAVVCAAATLLFLAGGVYGLRGWIEESWRISMLRSALELERVLAADRLGELRSYRAVEPLIEAIRAEPRESAWLFGSAPGHPAGGEWVELTPLAHALYRAGAGALRVLERAESRCNAARDAGSNAEWSLSSILTVIRNLWSHPEMPVRRLGYSDRPGTGIPY